jgi:signal peptidase I
MSNAASPLGLIATGFDWHGRSGRGAFGAMLAGWAFLIGVLVAGPDSPFWSRGAEVSLILAIALLLVPMLGHVMRRLNDVGRSGWWGGLVLVPYAGLLLLVYLLIAPPRARRLQTETTPLRLVGFILACLLALLTASRVFWTPYLIPASSMKPTLLVGDVIAATRLPGLPDRGDVVVFAHPLTGQPFVKRIVGLPGDSVQMRDGVLHIDGLAVTLADAGFFDEVMEPQGPQASLPRCLNGAVGQGALCRKRLWRETLPGGRVHDILEIGETAMDNTALFVVPEGQLFVMGDNRDNSTDSRIAAAAGGIGFVPLDAVTGKVRRVLVSLSGRGFWAVWTLRPDRIWEAVE